MLRQSALFLFVVLATTCAVADELSVIKPEDAADHVDKEVIVEYTVMSARVIDDKNICFLNSARDNKDSKNFTSFITPKGMSAFKTDKQIANPGAEFVDKKIRVKGKILLHKSKPEIKVDSPDQIELVAVE